MGKATDSDAKHKVASSNFAAITFLGISLSLVSNRLVRAGKKSTGMGKTNLDIAVSMTACLPAIFEVP